METTAITEDDAHRHMPEDVGQSLGARLREQNVVRRVRQRAIFGTFVDERDPNLDRDVIANFLNRVGDEGIHAITHNQAVLAVQMPMKLPFIFDIDGEDVLMHHSAHPYYDVFLLFETWAADNELSFSFVAKGYFDEPIWYVQIVPL